MMRLSIEQVAGRAPVIVTISHFSTRIAAARAKAAADAGARMLMMMPPDHGALLKADELGMIEHFKAVADACGLPIINYESRQGGLRATKAVMKAGGVIKSDAVRHPLAPLHPKTREGLLELARELDPLALRWGNKTGAAPRAAPLLQ